MSLRDQLLAKGLVSKKRARKIERELKHERKVQQAQKKKKRELEREQAEAERAEREAEAARRAEERAARQAQREAVERELRVRNLLVGNRMPLGRGQRFWHRAPGGRHLQEAHVSSGLAHQLRAGEAALALLRRRGGLEEVVAIPRRAALKLQPLAPEALLFFVEDPSGISEPDLALHRRDWEPELGPHRATAADLARFREAVRAG